MRHALLLSMMLICGSAQAACEGSLLEVDAKRLLGASESLCQYRGKALLVVNTASQCGYTPQYEELEALWRDYRGRGLVVLGFPSDQFGGQEFDDDVEIAKFCTVNFGVSFPMYGKSAVTGDAAHPLFRKLAAATASPPRWNFHKYLIGRDGRTVSAYVSDVRPQSRELRAAIEQALAAPAARRP